MIVVVVAPNGVSPMEEPQRKAANAAEWIAKISIVYGERTGTWSVRSEMV